MDQYRSGGINDTFEEYSPSGGRTLTKAIKSRWGHHHLLPQVMDGFNLGSLAIGRPATPTRRTIAPVKLALSLLDPLGMPATAFSQVSSLKCALALLFS